MATHSSILAWRIPWTEEPGGLQCMVLPCSLVLHSLQIRDRIAFLWVCLSAKRYVYLEGSQPLGNSSLKIDSAIPSTQKSLGEDTQGQKVGEDADNCRSGLSGRMPSAAGNRIWDQENFSGGTAAKNPPVTAGDPGWIPDPGSIHMSWGI